MANYNRKKKKSNLNLDYNPPYDKTILAIPLEELKLREETFNLLKKANINTMLDILRREDKDFYRIMTFNKKNLFDLKSAISKYKVSFRPAQNVNNTKPVPNGNQKTFEEKKNHNQKQNEEKKNHNQKPGEEQKKKAPVVEKEVIVPDKYIKINKGDKWGFADRQGKEVIAPVYDSVFCFNEELCCVEKDELFGYIDREGELVIPITYDCACSFSEGLACVYKKDKCGYIDKSGNVIIDFEFDAGTAFEDKSCRVKRDGKWAELYFVDSEKEYEELMPYNLRWIN